MTLRVLSINQDRKRFLALPPRNDDTAALVP